MKTSVARKIEHVLLFYWYSLLFIILRASPFSPKKQDCTCAHFDCRIQDASSNCLQSRYGSGWPVFLLFGALLLALQHHSPPLVVFFQHRKSTHTFTQNKSAQSNSDQQTMRDSHSTSPEQLWSTNLKQFRPAGSTQLRLTDSKSLCWTNWGWFCCVSLEYLYGLALEYHHLYNDKQFCSNTQNAVNNTTQTTTIKQSSTVTICKTCNTRTATTWSPT